MQPPTVTSLICPFIIIGSLADSYLNIHFSLLSESKLRIDDCKSPHKRAECLFFWIFSPTNIFIFIKLYYDEAHHLDPSDTRRFLGNQMVEYVIKFQIYLFQQ